MDSGNIVLTPDQDSERRDATTEAGTNGSANGTAVEQDPAPAPAPSRRRRREYAVSVDDEKIELAKAHRICRNNTHLTLSLCTYALLPSSTMALRDTVA